MNSKEHVRLFVQIISRGYWLRELGRRSRRREYDWLYLYQPGVDGLLAAVIARYYHRHICSEYVDLLSPAEYHGPILRVIYVFQILADRIVPLFSNMILTISSALEVIYHKRNRDIPTMLFPTLVDTARFGSGDRSRFRRHLGLGERPIITFTGSFVRTEGLQVLFKAMIKVAEKHPNVMMMIAGGSLVSGSDDPVRLIEQLHLEENARCLGMIPEEDVIDLQSTSDILVMPKLDDPINQAGLSTKLAEYLASGKAVVASNVGDVGKYLRHEYDALLVPPGDQHALEQGLIRLLEEPELRHKLGINARETALRHFDIKVNMTRLVKALSERRGERAL